LLYFSWIKLLTSASGQRETAAVLFGKVSFEPALTLTTGDFGGDRTIGEVAGNAKT
jgi:hypothetical protein